MKIRVLFLGLSLIACPCFSASTPALGVSIIGSVAKPGAYDLTSSNATLSSMLEAAGGLWANGSGKIGITFTGLDGIMRTFQVDGLKFYAGDRDYLVTPGTVIFISQCDYVGLDQLSVHDLELINKKRAEYLERKKAGKIQNIDLLEACVAACRLSRS